MATKDVIVVFKINFEKVHDESMLKVKADLDLFSIDGEVVVE